MIKRIHLVTFIAIFISFTFTRIAMTNVFRVSPEGSDTSPYDTWAKAATDLQIAIDLAADTPGGPHQVWVKKGVYKPQFSTYTDAPIPREYCFSLRKNVEVYGGFAGRETVLAQRDYLTNQTILSGDQGDADTWNDGTPIVDGSGNFNPPPAGDPSLDLPVLNNSSNVYNVIRNTLYIPIDQTTLLDGFIITGGYADGPNYYGDGGGMYNWSTVSNLANCTFSGNAAYVPDNAAQGFGGGLLARNSNLTNCTFLGNSATCYGGGLYGGYNTLNDCNFTGNWSADRGGGAACVYSILNDCIFTGNSAYYQGGGMTGGGTLTNCTFSGNSAINWNGGGLDTAFSTLINCIFSENSANRDGGGMHGGDNTLFACTFSGNAAKLWGGGYAAGDDVLIACTFCDNSASRGGGISVLGCALLTNCTLSDNSASELGGGMYLDELGAAPSVLTNCTFSENSAPTGGGISGNPERAPSSILATSNIFYGDSGIEFSDLTDLSSVRYSIVEGDISEFGPGCSNTNPDLGSFGYYGGITDCYSIAPGSPAINAGASVYQVTSDNNELIYLEPGSSPTQYFRIADGTEYDTTGETLQWSNSHDQRGRWRDEQVDIGSYEYGAMPSPTTTVTPTPTPTPYPTPDYLVLASGDYTGDGKSDIAIFRPDSGLWAVRGLGRIYFGRAGDIPVSGDYDGDGIADVSIYRPSSGLWAIKGITRLYFGGSDEIPIPGGYNGDGSCDIGLFGNTSGRWTVRGISRVYFGASGDYPVPGDYDGDRKTDISVFRPATGLWAMREISRCYFGARGDQPVPGVHSWYGRSSASPFKNQIAIYRPSSGLWALRGYTRFYFGTDGDSPLLGDFNGDSLDDTTIFRPDSGLWAIRGVSKAYFGTFEDIPVTR